MAGVGGAVFPDELAAGALYNADAAVFAAGEDDIVGRGAVESVGVGPFEAALEGTDRIARRIEELPEVDATDRRFSKKARPVEPVMASYPGTVRS